MLCARCSLHWAWEYQQSSSREFPGNRNPADLGPGVVKDGPAGSGHADAGHGPDWNQAVCMKYSKHHLALKLSQAASQCDFSST